MKKDKRQPWTRTSIQCVDTGEVFDSARAAAIYINVGDAAMSNHLAGRCDSLNGKKFKRVPKED